MRFASAPEQVYAALATDNGRRNFWAESSIETDGVIEFEFISGERLEARVLAAEAPERFELSYFGDSHVAFEIAPDGDGGSDLTLTERGVAAEDRTEQIAGWLNVLFPLKAYVDHGIDLRNRDAQRTWRLGYADQ